PALHPSAHTPTVYTTTWLTSSAAAEQPKTQNSTAPERQFDTSEQPSLALRTTSSASAPNPYRIRDRTYVPEHLGLALEQAELHGSAGRLRAGATPELGQDIADVHVEGGRAEEQLPGDLAVGAPDRDKAQHLELTS